MGGQAKRFTFHFDGVAWDLCNDRTPFVRAVLSGIFLENVTSVEGSGTDTPNPISYSSSYSGG